MDLRRTRTFVTVADLGSVSKAALRLRIAQPALSRQISELEQEVGFKLFDRVGRRLVLTGEGEQLLKDCRGLLNYASALDERAQLLRRGDTGVLKVAAHRVCWRLRLGGRRSPVPMLLARPPWRNPRLAVAIEQRPAADLCLGRLLTSIHERLYNPLGFCARFMTRPERHERREISAPAASWISQPK